MTRAALITYAPWTDRAGRLSWMKLATFLVCLAPLVWMAWEWRTAAYPNPMRGLIRETGDWAMRFIALLLAITPLRYATRWNRPVLLRRMLGLTGLFYTLLHLGLYLVDRKFNLQWIVLELFWRIYISAGWVATIIFVIMGVTSNDQGIRKLGSARWNQWHAWVYPAALLSLLHIFILVRLDLYEATVTLGFVAFVIGFRLLRSRGLQGDPARLLKLGVGIGLVLAIFEALFYRWATRVDMMLVLKANFDFTYRVRPVWWIISGGLLMACLAFWRRGFKRPEPPRSLQAKA